MLDMDRETGICPEELEQEARELTREVIEKAKLTRGRTLVVGCSSSEICGDRIGTHSSLPAARAVFSGIYEVLQENGIYLAAQCCEHLNRAVIIEREAVPAWAETVSVVPQPHAGGSFATTAYYRFADPVALESVRADAGIDIGGTLIGMQLRPVAVPLKLLHQTVGAARVIAAGTRPRYIGGIRAAYEPEEEMRRKIIE